MTERESTFREKVLPVSVLTARRGLSPQILAFLALRQLRKACTAKSGLESGGFWPLTLSGNRNAICYGCTFSGSVLTNHFRRWTFREVQTSGSISNKPPRPRFWATAHWAEDLLQTFASALCPVSENLAKKGIAFCRPEEECTALCSHLGRKRSSPTYPDQPLTSKFIPPSRFLAHSAVSKKNNAVPAGADAFFFFLSACSEKYLTPKKKVSGIHVGGPLLTAVARYLTVASS